MTERDARGRKTADLNAKTLRAMAHPLRVRLVGILRMDGPATATGLAKRVGESSGTTSWHLRQLAEVGMVEEDADRGNKRERWWRAAHAGHRTGHELYSDPELAGPASDYLHSILTTHYRAAADFVSERQEWPAWQGAWDFSDYLLHLTPEKARELNEKVDALVESYRRDPGEGDELVAVQWHAFPRKRHPERP
ncbi:ArsR family transcriptional regulator [Herbihabitans rhizosphaerae]|uniref:ArsR family transcriptional regulator n=1 Tax=Herbihabitans rhizosphaerae TaxID=1872711 RepID=A0A4V2EU92_9PSEU|nr:helix-turn-helix domain-containing protein [Herbihabitans rhizosphaerae]RZS43763.1 ArsR family transcriptional regulator [Herbihabitans rhizosphaerae]